MDYIRVTKDNLEKEHICCAISNNKDIQTYRSHPRKHGLPKDSMRDLFSLKALSGENALSSISRRRMHGFRLSLTDTCTLTACGYPDPLRDTDTQRTS